MAPIALEKEDHSRDAAFNKAMHGKSADAQGGMSAMFRKDKAAQQAAVEEYFKHFDNKVAGVETEEDRKVHDPHLNMLNASANTSQARRDEYATLTRQYGSQSPHLPS